MFSLQKPNYDVPEYSYLKFTICTVANYDVVPTSVFVKIECLDEKKEAIHCVLSTITFWTNVLKTDASMRQVKKVLNIIRRIPKPSVGVIYDIGDLATYSILSGFINPIVKHNHFCLTKTRAIMREHNFSCEINLVNTSEWMNEFSMMESFTFRKKMTASEEQTGDALKFWITRLEQERHERN